VEEKVRGVSSSGQVEMEVENMITVTATGTLTPYGHCLLVLPLKMVSFLGLFKKCRLTTLVFLIHTIFFCRYSEACSSTLATTYSSGSAGEQKVVTTGKLIMILACSVLQAS